MVVDPWIDHEPLRIYNAEQLAERAAEENADLLIVEADRCAGPVFERDLIAVCSCRGDPTNVDVEAATKAGVPVIRAPGRNADAVAELTVALLLAASRGIVPADHDVRVGEVYKDGTIPYQRYRAWQLAGRTAGLVGLGAVGRATKWRLEGLGMQVIATDPFAVGCQLLARRTSWSIRCRLHARRGQPRHRGDDRGGRVRSDARRGGLRELGPCGASRQ